jgi:hypothetical protein
MNNLVSALRQCCAAAELCVSSVHFVLSAMAVLIRDGCLLPAMIWSDRGGGSQARHLIAGKASSTDQGLRITPKPRPRPSSPQHSAS